MHRDDRKELMSAVVAKLEEVAQMLTTAEEAVLADQAEHLADLVDVIASPGNGAEVSA
jgi:hypothetical protein